MSIYDDLLSEDKSLKQYNLKRNPFDIIAAENMSQIEIEKMHVITTEDRKIATNLKSVLGGSSATVALIGEYGSGKSIRAKNITEVLKQKGALTFYTKLQGGAPSLVTYALFESVCIPIINNDVLPEELREFAQKLWEEYRDITKKSETKFKPFEAGQKLASIFKKISDLDLISGLIIDEFEEIIEESIKREIRKTFEILREFLSHVAGISGHITTICSTPNAWASLKEIHPAVATRIHVEIEFKAISDKVATDIVKKRLSAFRSNGADGLTPFDEETIKQVNKEYASGNPRLLLIVLRSILNVASQNKVKKISLESIDEGVEFAREKLKDAQTERIKQILSPKMRNILEIIISEKNGGPIVGTALSDELGMDQGNLSRYLNQMAALNFLNKTRDGRIVSYEIKPELRLIFEEELGLTADSE